MKKRSIASVLILIAGCLWGCMGLFVHTLNEMGITAMQMVEIRAVITTVLLFAALAVFKPSLLKIRRRHLWCFVGNGICSIVFFNFCYFRTIESTSMSLAAVLLYTSPIFVMLLSAWLFKEAFTVKKWCALCLAFIGCILVSGVLTGNTPLTPLGFLTGIGAGIGYALYSIFSRFAIRYGYEDWTIIAYTFLFAALGGAVFTDFGQIAATLTQHTLSRIGFLLLFTMITTILPYITYTAGLRQVENSKAALLASIEPVVATILGLLVYKEIPTPLTAVGVVAVLAAVLLLSLPTKKSPLA